MTDGKLAMTFPGEAAQPPLLPSVQVSQTPLDLVRSIEIKGQPQLTEADLLRSDILADLKKVESVFRPLIDQAHVHHKALLARMKEFTEPREQALDVLKRKISDYLEEQDRIRLQAQREAELKQQEAKRLEEKATDKAWKLTDKGQAGKAEEVLKEAQEKANAVTSSAPAIPDIPIANVSRVTRWDFEIIDLDKLKREAPEYTVPNEAAIRKHGTNLKDQARIPGVRFFPVKTVADKGSRR